MHTEIVKIDQKSLSVAKRILDDGGLVAFPTETVYGLGADATNSEAVRKIYAVKGRPQDNPLIVHVHSGYDITYLVKDVPQYARALAEKFLPGPLTMVYKSRGKVAREVSCGLDTLAVRVPSHVDAQQFLKYVNLPVAAPSANMSRHVSPVTAEHVFSDLNGKIPLILEGGKCSGGIESTVLDCTGATPCILRSGLITREMIASIAGGCDVFLPSEGQRVRSPGMKYRHYSPNCQTMLFGYEERFAAFAEYRRRRADGVNAYLMCDDGCADEAGEEYVLRLGNGGEAIAANLYERLREGEKVAQLIIAIAPEERGGVMEGVINRLTKACGIEK